MASGTEEDSGSKGEGRGRIKTKKRGREMRGNDALSKGGSEGSEEGEEQGGREEEGEEQGGREEEGRGYTNISSQSSRDGGGKQATCCGCSRSTCRAAVVIRVDYSHTRAALWFTTLHLLGGSSIPTYSMKL